MSIVASSSPHLLFLNWILTCWCVSKKGKSNQLYYIYIYIYIYKYSYWIVHIAGGAGGRKKRGLGVQQHKRRRMKKNEAIKRRPKEENVKLPEQKCSCLCPRFLFTLAACVSPWMAAAARRVKPTPAWDKWRIRSHLAAHRGRDPPSSQERTSASLCSLNGPAPPASRPLSPPSLHLIRSAGVGVPLIRPITI